jgi:hypothetical protein
MVPYAVTMMTGTGGVSVRSVSPFISGIRRSARMTATLLRLHTLGGRLVPGRLHPIRAR